MRLKITFWSIDFVFLPRIPRMSSGDRILQANKHFVHSQKKKHFVHVLEAKIKKVLFFFILLFARAVSSGSEQPAFALVHD